MLSHKPVSNMYCVRVTLASQELQGNMALLWGCNKLWNGIQTANSSCPSHFYSPSEVTATAWTWKL